MASRTVVELSSRSERNNSSHAREGLLPNKRNKAEESIFHSLAKEGWTRPQENIAKQPCWERTGWFVQTTDNRWLERIFLTAARYRACASRPSARANVALRNLLD